MAKTKAQIGRATMRAFTRVWIRPVCRAHTPGGIPDGHNLGTHEGDPPPAVPALLCHTFWHFRAIDGIRPQGMIANAV